MRWDNMGFNYAEGKETSKNVLVCLCQKTPDRQNVQETKDGSYTMISQLTYFSSALWMEIKPCQCASAPTHPWLYISAVLKANTIIMEALH